MIPELALLPAILLVAAGLLMVGLGFFVKRASVLWTTALATAAVATLITIDMMGLSWSNALGLSLWPVPGAGDSGALTAWKMDVDMFALLFHLVFLVVTLLVIIASRAYVKRDEPHQAEYYALLFFAVAGMMLVAAATDLFVLYLAFELTSLSTFALVAFRKQDKRATEASLKFFVIGAISSAIILFGISLVYILSGSVPGGQATTDLALLKSIFVTAISGGFEAPLIVAVIFLLAGFGFKVATVPFHMWAPDVYEGSPTTVSAFLAAGSKKVGVVAMFKVFLIGLLAVQVDWMLAIAALAIATMTVGNVLAIPQRNIKRMLAYSSIAQAGYILIAIVVAGVAYWTATPVAGDPYLETAAYGLTGGIFHVFTHMLMKSGAFLVVAAAAVLFIGEDLEGWKGLGRRSPFLGITMFIFMLSLAGIPPFGGFFSKFVLFSSAIDASTVVSSVPGVGWGPWLITLAVAGVLNSALSLYYYARVIRYMWIIPPGDDRPLETPGPLTAAIAIAAVGTVLAGILSGPLIDYMLEASRVFLGG